MFKSKFYKNASLGIALTALLNSCYFNSTGKLRDYASFQASANTADLATSPTPQVLSDGYAYYIELPRYRFGPPVKLQYFVFDQNPVPLNAKEQRGTGLFRIPKEYAMYLIGKESNVTTALTLEEVPDADSIKSVCCHIPVVKDPGERIVSYTYRHPQSEWLNAAVPFNWLLIDMPITVAQNAAIVAAVAGYVYLSVKHDPHCPGCD